MEIEETEEVDYWYEQANIHMGLAHDRLIENFDLRLKLEKALTMCSLILGGPQIDAEQKAKILEALSKLEPDYRPTS